MTAAVRSLSMSNTDSSRDAHSAASLGNRSLMERIMAISEVERGFIARNPKLRREIVFQVFALMVCTVALGSAIYADAVNLLGHNPVKALVFGLAAAMCLFALDNNFLVQARGNASAEVRRSMYKVRAVSIAMITISFMLLTTDTFSTDIERVLADQRQAKRAELEQSPRYRPEIEGARAAVAQASEAARRAEEQQARILDLKTNQARAWEEHTNQCLGNTSGNKIRRRGCGPEAGGAEALANRLGAEIQAAEQDLARLGNVGERMASAKQQLAAIDGRIDAETELAFGGKSQRLTAMVPVLQEDLSAWIILIFWALAGMLPDMVMLWAQRPLFNNELFARMRAAEQEDLTAQIAEARRELRQAHTDRLAPLEVRLTPVPSLSDTGSASANEPDYSGRAAPEAPMAGERP
jgi:hypothetical protein